VVALPTEVTSPVRLAFVVTLPAVKPAAVPVMFVPTKADGVPRAGVTSVGLLAKTAEPVPVSSVRAVAKLAELNEPKDVAFPTDVTAPVKLAFVVTLPAVRPAAVPVMFVPTKADGVPNAGVTRVGEVLRTVFPEPVEVVTPVPPLATGSVPVTPVVRGKPVAFVKMPLDGVPSAGVTRVGEVLKTVLPEPVEVVTPVPPLATASVPARVTEPVVAVLGVRPVVPALNAVTPPAVPLAAVVMRPLESTVRLVFV